MSIILERVVQHKNAYSARETKNHRDKHFPFSHIYFPFFGDFARDACPARSQVFYTVFAFYGGEDYTFSNVA